MSKPTREWVENEIAGYLPQYEDDARMAAILRYALAAAPLLKRANTRVALLIDDHDGTHDDECLHAEILDAIDAQPWSDA